MFLRVGRIEEPEDLAYPAFYDQLLGQREAWARVYLQGVADRLAVEGIAAEPQVAVGLPEHEIAEMAGANGAQLVAMATHGRAGIGRMVLGSVTDRVLCEGKMPLLLFHPKNQRATTTKSITSCCLRLLAMTGCGC